MTTKHKHHAYDLYDDVEKIKAAFTGAALNVKDRAGEILINSVDNVKEQSTVVKDNMADYVAEKPFKSLGIALAVGVALGFLLRK